MAGESGGREAAGLIFQATSTLMARAQVPNPIPPLLPASWTAAMEPPNVDSARQAIDAIRGYEYQILAATLAWVDLDEDGLLYLEVAEDYATVVDSAIEAVQVKDTRASGSVTLNTPAVRDAIASFVDLTERNPDRQVQLRFFTTSPIGIESASRDRPGGLSGLTYWQRVRAGREDLGPLRTVLERETYPEPVRKFCAGRSDQELLAGLIHQVTWDCGRPQTASLRQELEQRLVRVLRTEFSAPSQDAPRVADILTYRVLQRSAMPDPQERVLSRSELHQLVDYSTRLTVARADFELLLRSALAKVPQPGLGQSVVTQGNDDPAWVVDVSRLPAPKLLVPRPAVEAAVHSALNSTGVCFVVGPTGIGKSMVARAVASTYSHGAHCIDFRDVGSLQARNRLDQVLGLLGGMGSSTIMLEDLNCSVAPTVQLALAQVVEAARRHDMRVLVSCYRRPSATVLNGLGTGPVSVVICPPFELEETSALVSSLGGDPSIWGRVAHIAGGSGHPQLTHTFVAGMAARDWPVQEISQIVKRGFTSADVDDAREAARASMVESLPEPSRHLLYRLSVASAPFKRSLALALGTVPPSIEHPGECLDKLVGPWVEAATPDRYRASPMVRGFGREMLTAEEQRQVHHAIANETISDGSIDVADIDTILVHGLAGDSQTSLFKLSGAINVADDETRRALAAHVALFSMLDTSKPIYPKDPVTSVMLRLAQLRLATASDKRDDVEGIAHALLREAEVVPDHLAGPHLESAVIGPILINLGIANHVRNWVELLSRFCRLERADQEGAITTHLEIPTGAALFSIGTAGLDSVNKLEVIFEDLGALAPDERGELLAPLDPTYADHDLLVHGPWVAQSRQPDFDAAQAVASYERMARQVDTWGDHRTLGIQCRVAVATIQDECLDDRQSALRTLNDAATTFGEDPILARAFAKLHHRSGQSADALAFYRDALPHIEGTSPVAATHALRGAAVCAATCGEWDTARAWFLRAQTVSEPLEAIGLGAIRVGLGADAAVASYEAGDLGEALGLLKDTLLALGDLNPDSNLQSAHCHRVVRHTVLWLKSKVGQYDTRVQGEPIVMLHGACSNPEPVPEIEQHPLGHIDFAWYMLAEVELVAGLDLGIREMVRRRGARGQIPLSELALRLQILGVDAERLDPPSFSEHLLEYVAASAYCYANRSELGESFDVLNPARAVIPAVSMPGPFDPVTEQAARHAILAYGVRSLFKGRPRAIFELRDSLTAKWGQSFPGKGLFDGRSSLVADSVNLDDEVAVILAACCESDRPPPDRLFRIGLHLLDWVTQSSFKPFLMPDFTTWLRHQWRRVLETQRFLLLAPASTVSTIEEVLQSPSTGERFAAKLSLVTAVAVNVRLGQGFRERLSQLAGGA